MRRSTPARGTARCRWFQAMSTQKHSCRRRVQYQYSLQQVWSDFPFRLFFTSRKDQVAEGVRQISIRRHSGRCTKPHSLRIRSDSIDEAEEGITFCGDLDVVLFKGTRGEEHDITFSVGDLDLWKIVDELECVVDSERRVIICWDTHGEMGDGTWECLGTVRVEI